MSDAQLVGVAERLVYPKGFRARRGLNWFILGSMYAAYYMCRYNFRWATPYMQSEFGFDKLQITWILSVWSIAYGTGQLVNGLLTDRIGGKTSMLIGAFGTVTINFIYGFSSYVSTFTTFALIWLVNGWFQSFGAPGMIKINAAWFNRTERGTFSGVFGLMIQMGQVLSNYLSPLILAGFSIGIFVVAEGEWRWLFRLPPLITAVIAVLLAFIPKETPEEAGFPGLIHDEIHGSTGGDARSSIRESFRTIFRHPLVWMYATAYACTGSVRHSSDQLSILYFKDKLGLDMENKPRAVMITMFLVPIVGVVGSFLSGWISDKFFKGQRSPVAMVLYFTLSLVVLTAGAVIYSGFVGPTPMGIFLGCFFLIMISMSVNATHSIVGAAAPMDIGGRRMAGFASGVIDSFQYYGAAITLPITGWLIDKYGWVTWFPSMAIFGVIGGLAMISVMRKQKRMARASV
jgi:OPA family glycerol-3-phosphate transporter-like MFS transporter